MSRPARASRRRPGSGPARRSRSAAPRPRPSPKRRPGFSAARLARASSTLTKETPTRARTVAVAAGVEARVGAGRPRSARVARPVPGVALAAVAPGFSRLALPGAVGLERAIEDGGEVDPVARALAAEEAAGGGPGDLPARRVDADLGEVVRAGRCRRRRSGRWRAGCAGKVKRAIPVRVVAVSCVVDRAAVDRVEADRVVARAAPLSPAWEKPGWNLPSRRAPRRRAASCRAARSSAGRGSRRRASSRPR